MDPQDTFDPAEALGWVPPEQRTQEQQDAHEATLRTLPRLSLPVPELPKGTMIVLPHFLKRPEVIEDIGFEFTGFGQYSGSCVGVSDGNAGALVGAVQRCIEDAPKKAFLPFWPWNYGRSRALAGFRGQGSGSLCSVMGKQNENEGFVTWSESAIALPKFAVADGRGFWIPKATELQFSDGARLDPRFVELAAPMKGMSRAVIEDIGQVRASIVNGYPVNNGCDNYAGSGQVVSGAGSPYTKTRYTTAGGHATNFVAVWNHPNDGYLYLYWNQWPTETYPTDPAAGVRCSAWMTEAEAAKLFRTGGSGGETFAMSNIPSFPLQPKVIDNYV